jgi:hypothetical protein
MPYNPTTLHALQLSVAEGYNKYATLTELHTELLPAEVENNH